MVVSISQYYRKGGPDDVAVSDGGTDASAVAGARTNLGITVFDSTSHDALDHLGAPLSLLDETAHDVLDHTGLTGIATWTKFTKTFSDFAVAATSNDIELFSLPLKTVIHRVVIKHTLNFGGGGITSYTVSVGLVGDLVKYSPAFDVFTVASNTNFLLTNTTNMENFGAATSIRINAITDFDKNLDVVTQGSVDVYVLQSVLP